MVQVGLIGLGTMGRGLAHALARAGLVVHAFEPIAGENLPVPDGVRREKDLSDMIAALARRAQRLEADVSELLETNDNTGRAAAREPQRSGSPDS